MDPLKDAFSKVKEDIDYLFQEIQEIKRTLKNLISNQQPTQLQQTNQHIIPTHSNTPTHIPTHNLPLEASKQLNSNISIGNEGVPTNKPTNQQTNQHPLISTGNSKIDQLKRASEIISSLDSLRKEVRFKFKKLTNQEMLIFSTIYQLEEQGFLVDYSLIAEKTNLTEISIRDYIRKIINKGIPLNKLRENNKKVTLSIPQDLKKIATLNTINQLREL